MSKNSRRHRRAYVAGAHSGIARLRAVIAPLLPADARSALDKMTANVTAEFPMPPVWRRDKVPAPEAFALTDEARTAPEQKEPA